MKRCNRSYVMAKILILNGSPRLKGNTAHLCDAFAKGAQGAGHEVVRFDLQKMKISGCIGCMKGGKDKASPCTIKDDMDKIYPHYEACDLVVLASPMYYWTISGQLKAAFDRLFAVAECNPDYKNPVKDCCLIMPAEDTGADNWTAITCWYDKLCQVLGWHDRGRILVGGVLEAGSVAQTDTLADAEKLGASI